jgi:hypothetical protein
MKKLRPHVLAGLALILSMAAASQAAVIRLKVTAELANIRLKPSISSVIVRQIKEGALLEATRKEGEFYLVKLDPDDSGATSGYVHESLVLVLDAGNAPEKMPRIVERAEPPKPKPIDETQPERIESQPVSRTETRPAETTRVAEKNPASVDPETGRPAVVLTVGGNFAAVGDLNDGGQGLADYYAYQLGLAADQKVQALHFAPIYGLEMIFPLSRQFYLSAGLEYYGATKETLVTYTQGLTSSTLKVTPEYRAIPVKIAFVFYPNEFIYFKIGAAYAFARAAYAYRFDHGAFWQDWSGEATAGAFGFFGALGFELTIDRTFAFIVEAAGQSLSVSGLSGTGTFQDSTMTAPVTESGKLFSYDGQPTPLNSYPLLFLRSKTPTEGGVANAREATLDLSGLSFKAGFKIKF